MRIENELIDALEPAKGFVLATQIYGFVQSGIYGLLKEGRQTIKQLSEATDSDPMRLVRLIHYFENEGLLTLDNDVIELTQRGQILWKYRAWYRLLVGGYGETFLNLHKSLPKNTPFAERNSAEVGAGSCEMDHFATIPMTLELLATSGSYRQVVDIGCGSAGSLIELCTRAPTLLGWGIEPSDGYHLAVNNVSAAGLSGRVRITKAGAIDFVDSPFEFHPDLAIVAFVLHEVLAQQGEDAVVSFLKKLRARFPKIHIVVIEVEPSFDDPRMMQHGLGRAYYNAYFLLHAFTNQELRPPSFWRSIFDRSGFRILAERTTNPKVDSTGLERGFLLAASEPD